MTTAPVIVALARDGGHRFSKLPAQELTLIAGQGVEGDAHCGVTVKHRSRVARDPSQPNLRQVHLGADVVLELTGLRNPCAQIDAFRPGLLAEMLPRGVDGQVIRRAGVMAIVLTGGVVQVGDAVAVVLPPMPYQPLAPV